MLGNPQLSNPVVIMETCYPIHDVWALISIHMALLSPNSFSYKKPYNAISLSQSSLFLSQNGESDRTSDFWHGCTQGQSSTKVRIHFLSSIYLNLGFATWYISCGVGNCFTTWSVSYVVGNWFFEQEERVVEVLLGEGKVIHMHSWCSMSWRS